MRLGIARPLIALLAASLLAGLFAIGCDSNERNNYGVGTGASELIASGMASACDFVHNDPFIDCEELEWNSEVLPAWDPSFTGGGPPPKGKKGAKFFFDMGLRYACHQLYDYACVVASNGRVSYGDPVVLGRR
jgi:hypothetical protein